MRRGQARLHDVQNRRRVHVDPLRLNHLDRQLTLRVRIGETSETVTAHASGERQFSCQLRALLLGRLLRPGTAREQVIARVHGSLEPRAAEAESMDGQLDLPADELLRIGEARQAVRAHAAGKREQCIRRRRRGGSGRRGVVCNVR